MDVRKLTEVAQFSSEKMQKINLFESSRMFCDIYCLEPDQKQKIHSHGGNDKIYYVVEGEGRFTIGQETRLLRSGESTCAFSGEAAFVLNWFEELKRLVPTDP